MKRAFNITIPGDGVLKFCSAARTGGMRTCQEFDLPGRSDRHFGVIDLFDQLPDGAWQTILKKGEEAGEGTLAHALNFQIHRALGEDRVIRIDTWNEPKGLLWLTPEEDLRMSYDKMLPPAPPPPPSFWDRAISSLVEGAGGLFRGAANVVLKAAEAVADLAQVGLAALAQVTDFMYLADLVDKARQFVDFFRQAVASVGGLVSALFSNPKKLGDNLITGVKKGLEDFFTPADQLFERVQKALFAWLFGELPNIANDLIEKAKKVLVWPLDVVKTFLFVLELLGLTWNNILGVLKDVASDVGISVDFLEKHLAEFLGVAEELVTTGTINVVGLVEKVYRMVMDEFNPRKLVDDLIEQAKQWLITKVAGKVATYLLGLVGGVGVLNLIYVGIKWILDNKDKIKELLDKVFGLFDLIVKENDEGIIAKRVFGVLDNFLPQALSLVGAALVGDVGKWISGVLTGISKTVLMWLRKALSKVFGKLWGKKGGCPSGGAVYDPQPGRA